MNENKNNIKNSNIIEKNPDIELIIAISALLNKVIQNNKDINNNSNDIFSSKTATNVTLEYYLQRIKKYTNIENSTFIISLIYIDRICTNKNIILHPLNVHRILLATIIIAIKYNEDNFYSNAYYSQVFGISLKELNILEMSSAYLLGFNFFINETDYKIYSDKLKNYITNNSK